MMLNRHPRAWAADLSIVALLHMDGVNDGNTFPDSSRGANVFTPHSVVTKTAQKKFGAASAYFGGSGYLESLNDVDWDMESYDSTLDCWVYPTALAEETIYDRYVDNNNRELLFLDAANLNYKVFDGGIKTVEIVAAHGMSVNNWYHVALVRYGNTMSSYVNGVSVGSDDVTGVSIPNYGASILIGANRYNGGLNAYANMYADEWCRRKGEAKWIANFTPPTQPYQS